MTKATPRKAPDSNESSSVGDSDNSSSSSSSTSSETEPAVATTEVEVVEPTDPQVAPPANSGYIGEDTKTIEDVKKDDTEALAYEGEPKDVEVSMTYVHHLDPRRQADPNGIYLDDIQRRDAEIVNARADGREPDLENPGPTAGTPLIPTVAAVTQANLGQTVPVSTTAMVNVGAPAEEEPAAEDAEDND